MKSVLTIGRTPERGEIGRSYGTRPQKLWNTYRKAEIFVNARNDKALNNQGFVVHKMAEAMGFELMDLLQSTVFKTVALNHSATPPFALRAP